MNVEFNSFIGGVTAPLSSVWKRQFLSDGIDVQRACNLKTTWGAFGFWSNSHFIRAVELQDDNVAFSLSSLSSLYVYYYNKIVIEI